MHQYIDIFKIFDLLKYDPNNPLFFTSFLFVIFFLSLLIIYRFFFEKKNYRVILLLIFSFFFYYKVSGFLFVVLIYLSIVNYFSAIIIVKLSKQPFKRIIFITSIILNLLPLIYFKYTNFFISILNDLTSRNIDFIYLLYPVGISFFTFKSLSYLFDIYLEKIEAERSFLDLTLFISFFANLLAGPIDRAGEFLPQIKKDVTISKDEIGMAMFLIISGLFKKVVIADYISLNFVDRIFDSPLRYTGLENLFAVYGYALQIYCDFSGYSDIAIGISLLLGLRLMDNFNSPYQSKSIVEFWRRWHISLSKWLLDYIFTPLQLKFRHLKKYANVIAILITFLICGFWHGAAWTFIFWGLLHGVYLSCSVLFKPQRDFVVDKLKLANTKILDLTRVIFTFHLVAISWVFFRAADFQTALNVFSQIFNFFHGGILLDFVSSFKFIVILMAAGYFLHFLPKSYEIKMQNLLARMPSIVLALILALFIWLAAQVRSADLQPFIYFNF
jgi:alginate O-acetyltransferase complex protein AlgI